VAAEAPAAVIEAVLPVVGLALSPAPSSAQVLVHLYA
jgi:hypothetical protein